MIFQLKFNFFYKIFNIKLKFLLHLILMFFETVFGLFFVYQLVKFLRFTFYKPNF